MKKGWMVDVLEKQLELAKNREEEYLVQIKCQSNLLKRQSEQVDRLTHEVASLTTSIQSLEKTLLEKDHFMESLIAKNHSLKRAFSPKSEKITAKIKGTPVAKKDSQCPQAAKPAEPAESQNPPAQCAEGSGTPTANGRGNNGAKRKDYFVLETQEHDIWPELEGFDSSLSKVLKTVECIRYEYVPGRFIKHIYRQHQCLEQGSLHAGKLPITPLLNSNFEASAIAGILQLRYIYSMPVERIIKLFTENGFDLCKSTAHGLIMKTATMFEKMEGVLKSAILEDNYINMDETYHTVLEHPEKSTSGKKSFKAYVWAALGRQSNLVQFFYGKGSRARKMLTDYVPPNYQGAIQSDGLANYKILETESYPQAIRLSCFQHCKREFIKLKTNRSAQRIVRIINKLYQKEHRILPDWTPQEILQYRNKYAPPILKELKQALLEIQGRKTTLPKSELSKAVNYTLNQYEALCNYIKQPYYDLDNNAIYPNFMIIQTFRATCFNSVA